MTGGVVEVDEADHRRRLVHEVGEGHPRDEWGDREVPPPSEDDCRGEVCGKQHRESFAGDTGDERISLSLPAGAYAAGIDRRPA